MAFRTKDLAVTNFNNVPTCAGLSVFTISKEICYEGSGTNRMAADSGAQLSELKEQLRQALGE